LISEIESYFSSLGVLPHAAGLALAVSSCYCVGNVSLAARDATFLPDPAHAVQKIARIQFQARGNRLTRKPSPQGATSGRMKMKNVSIEFGHRGRLPVQDMTPPKKILVQRVTKSACCAGVVAPENVECLLMAGAQLVGGYLAYPPRIGEVPDGGPGLPNHAWGSGEPGRRRGAASRAHEGGVTQTSLCRSFRESQYVGSHRQTSRPVPGATPSSTGDETRATFWPLRCCHSANLCSPWVHHRAVTDRYGARANTGAAEPACHGGVGCARGARGRWPRSISRCSTRRSGPLQTLTQPPYVPVCPQLALGPEALSPAPRPSPAHHTPRSAVTTSAPSLRFPRDPGVMGSSPRPPGSAGFWAEWLCSTWAFRDRPAKRSSSTQNQTGTNAGPHSTRRPPPQVRRVPVCDRRPSPAAHFPTARGHRTRR